MKNIDPPSKQWIQIIEKYKIIIHSNDYYTIRHIVVYECLQTQSQQIWNSDYLIKKDQESRDKSTFSLVNVRRYKDALVLKQKSAYQEFKNQKKDLIAEIKGWGKLSKVIYKAFRPGNKIIRIGCGTVVIVFVGLATMATTTLTIIKATKAIIKEIKNSTNTD